MISSMSFCITSLKYSEKILGKCIEGILKQNIPESEILIYSTKNMGGDIKNIYNEEWKGNVSLNKIRNYICSKARKEFVALIDTSVELASDWYSNIKKADYFDVIGSQLITPDMKRCVDWGYKVNTGKKYLYLPLHYDEWMTKAFINGALILIKKKVLELLKFNENISSWEGDDVDFCTRASEIGFRVGVIQGAKALWKPDTKKKNLKKYISVEKSFGIIIRYKKLPDERLSYIIKEFRKKLSNLLSKRANPSFKK